MIYEKTLYIIYYLTNIQNKSLLVTNIPFYMQYT